MLSRPIKCVIVGDHDIGKTALLFTYTTNCFPSEYIPKGLETYNANIMVDDYNIALALWDTNGSSDADPLRPLCFPQTDVFIVTFSIINWESYLNVSKIWAAPPLPHESRKKGTKPPGWQSIKNYCPDTPFILVGLKEDLKEDRATIHKLTINDKHAPVTLEQGNQLAKEIGAIKYFEVSSLRQKNLKVAIDELVRCALYRSKTKKEKVEKAEKPLKFQPGNLTVTLVKATNLKPADLNGLSDPWAAIGLYDEDGHFKVLKKSKVIKETLNPEWNENFLLLN